MHLGIHELRYQRAARFAQLVEDHGGRLHGVEVLSAQDSPDVLSEGLPSLLSIVAAFAKFVSSTLPRVSACPAAFFLLPSLLRTPNVGLRPSYGEKIAGLMSPFGAVRGVGS